MIYVTQTEFKKLKRCVVCTTTILAEDDIYFEVPEGRLLDNIVLISDANQTLDIGTTPSGTEIASSESLVAGTPLIVSVSEYGSTIYITGITDPTTVKFYIR